MIALFILAESLASDIALPASRLDLSEMSGHVRIAAEPDQFGRSRLPTAAAPLRDGESDRRLGSRLNVRGVAPRRPIPSI
jgi:hypothetical protein